MIAIVSHDAGGAEILASYVGNTHCECLYALGGPALKVFERRLGAVPWLPLADAIARADWVLTGTSWQSDLEWQALGIARRAGKRTITFLDHWGNFRQRFIRDGEERLPEEIWVGDSLAEQYARDSFGCTPVRLVPNPYFEDLRREFGARRNRTRSAEGLDVLFVSEPLREHGLREFGNALHWGYTEFDALRYLLANLSRLGTPVRNVIVRPHPSEPADKYNGVSVEFGSHVRPGGERTLLEEIADCDVVAGCESMAMVVGLIAGRRVVCCIPPGGRPCALPHTEIESLQKMVATG